MMPGTNIPLDADATSLGAAQANQLASSKVMVANMNANLKTIYLTAFNNWSISVFAGRIPNNNPPQPPKAYVVGAPDGAGFQWPEVGSDPVCPMPPVPEDHFTPAAKVPNNIQVGARIGTGNWFQVGAQDTMAPGMQTPPVTSADGIFAVFEKFAAPVGAGWYLKVS